MAIRKSGRDDPRFVQVEDVQQYLGSDLARTHGFTRSTGADQVDAAVVAEQHEQLLRDGYIILHDMVTQGQREALKREAEQHLDKMGRNSFEGERTQRIYGVPEKMRAADPFIVHPLVQAHLDRLFQPNYLLSQAQVINILADSPAQPFHMDDGFYAWPQPRPALSAATVFAIDAFTEDNGATVAIPGSHRWPQGRGPRQDDSLVKAVMPAGSCILFLGNLWHGGGENRSQGDRMGFTAQYCEPWLRTQENFFLTVSKATAANVSEDLRRLLGYSIHPPFMGMSEGMHPKRKLPLSE